MPKIRDWERDIENIEVRELKDNVEKKNRSNFRKGLSFDDRKRGKVKRGKPLPFDEDGVD